MSNVRVTYSGFISFIIGLVSIVTGLIFTVIVTRQLSQEAFGIWSLIGGLTAYVFILRPIIGFWNTREIARGEESGKTAIIANSFLIIFALIMYYVISYFYGNQTSIDFGILIFGALLIPVEFMRSIIVGISNGYKPHIEEYGLLVFEIVKICVGIILIYFLQMSIEGVIITSVIASLASILLMGVIVRERLKGEFKRDLVKKWIKLFWIPAYPQISTLMTTIDVSIFTLITGSVSGLAYWTAARSVSRIVHQSNKIGKAVYAKLLSGGEKKIFQENLVLKFYFAIPLSGLSLAFMKPSLFILNPLYEIAFPVVIFLVPTIFLRSLGELLMDNLKGLEKVDLKEDARFIDYIKSKLFFLPTLRNIHRVTYLISLASMLIILIQFPFTDLELVIYWAMLSLIIQIPFSIYLIIITKKEIKKLVDLKPIIKYLITGMGVFGSTYWLMEEFMIYHIGIFDFLPQVIPFFIISVLSFLGITYIIDKRTKILVNAIIKEVRKKK